MSNYDAVVLADGPLGFWKMDEPSGITMNDSSGNGQNGTFASVTLGVTGIGDGSTAASFNGSTSAASVAINLSAQNVITLEFWLKASSFTNTDLLAFEMTNNFNNFDGSFIVNPNSSSPSGIFSFASHLSGQYNGGHLTAGRPSTGVWHHYAIVYTVTGGTHGGPVAYLDGLPVSTTNDVDGSYPGGQSFINNTLYMMSRATTSLFMAGQVAKVALYSGALPAGRVAAHYNATSTTVVRGGAFLPQRLGPRAVGPTFFAAHRMIGLTFFGAPQTLQASSSVASGSLTLIVSPIVPLAVNSAVASGSNIALVVVPILPLVANSAAASGTLQLSAIVPLQASSSAASGTCAITAPSSGADLPLQASSSAAAGTLQLSPLVPLAANSAIASGSLTLIVQPTVVLQASASTASGTLQLSAMLPLQASSSAATTGSLGISVPGPAPVTTAASSSTASGTLTLIVQPTVVLAANASTASASMTVLAFGAALTVAANSATVSATLALRTAAPLTITASNIVATTGTLGLLVRPLFTLTATGAATGSLVVFVPGLGNIPLQAVSTNATGSLTLIARSIRWDQDTGLRWPVTVGGRWPPDSDDRWD